MLSSEIRRQMLLAIRESSHVVALPYFVLPRASSVACHGNMHRTCKMHRTCISAKRIFYTGTKKVHLECKEQKVTWSNRTEHWGFIWLTVVSHPSQQPIQSWTKFLNVDHSPVFGSHKWIWGMCTCYILWAQPWLEHKQCTCTMHCVSHFTKQCQQMLPRTPRFQNIYELLHTFKVFCSDSNIMV